PLRDDHTRLRRCRKSPGGTEFSRTTARVRQLLQLQRRLQRQLQRQLPDAFDRPMPALTFRSKDPNRISRPIADGAKVRKAPIDISVSRLETR
ncbi:MAG: hypothetical protein OXE40_05115, partial [Gammaproteobacteria bacterium]|nr:hypothetical protein [Gammaproteobacteria bacterium]